MRLDHDTGTVGQISPVRLSGLPAGANEVHLPLSVF